MPEVKELAMKLRQAQYNYLGYEVAHPDSELFEALARVALEFCEERVNKQLRKIARETVEDPFVDVPPKSRTIIRAKVTEVIEEEPK